MASTADTDLVKILVYGGSTKTGSLSATDIGTVIDNNSHVYLAAAEVALAEASVIARTPTKKVGDLSKSFVGMETTFRGIAADLKMKAAVRAAKPVAPAISRAAKDTARIDTDRVKPAFKVGMHDHGVTSTGEF